MFLAGACAADSAGPSDTTTPADTTTGCDGASAGCESTLSLEDVVELAESTGSSEFSQAVLGLYGPLSELSEGCEDFAGWTEEVDAVTKSLDEASALADQVDSTGSTEMNDADRLARWVEDTLVLGSACDEVAELDVALGAAGSAVGAADRFRFALTGYTNTAEGSRFWSFHEQPGHVAEALRLIEAEDGVDILLTGDSSVKWGFDPLVLSESTGEVAANFSANGLPATVYQRWLDDLDGVGVSPGAVVVGVSSWGTLISCSDPRIGAYDAASQARTASFGLVEPLAQTDPTIRVAGGRTGRYDSVLMDRFNNERVPDGQGLVTRDETSTPDGDENWLNGPYARQFTQPRPCADNVAAIGELAAEMSERGVALYVVAMPLSEQMAQLHPDGRAGHVALVEG